MGHLCVLLSKALALRYYTMLRRHQSDTLSIIAARPEDYERVQRFSERLVRQALAWEGTASGEHGIGLVKRGFMIEEHGANVTCITSKHSSTQMAF